MKMKSFVMIAMLGIIALPLAYIAPAMAEEDTEQADQAMQMLSDNGMQAANDTASTDDKDAGSPDTATGDDDY